MKSFVKKEKDPRINLALQEFDEDPFRRFNVAFALMSVIPFLVSLYILVTRLFSFDILVGDVGLVLFISILVSLCGLFVGYGIIKNVLRKVVYNAALAKKCNTTKSSFVATVSHELRNPIFVLSANIEGMLEGMYGQIGEKQANSLRTCKDVINRMEMLVTNLLDLYKIEAGMVKLRKEACDVCALLEKQMKEMDVLIREKRVSVIKDCPKEALTAWADKDKITQVINNLLSNAVKYSPEGGRVSVRVFSTGEFVRLEIEDNGPGIPEDKLKRIFDKFERLDETTQGVGLGLAITKDIVELHGGKIWAESAPGQGSKFIVVLPCVPKNSTPQ